jgi:hypothetical protein
VTSTQLLIVGLASQFPFSWDYELGLSAICCQKKIASDILCSYMDVGVGLVVYPLLHHGPVAGVCSQFCLFIYLFISLIEKKFFYSYVHTMFESFLPSSPRPLPCLFFK